MVRETVIRYCVMRRGLLEEGRGCVIYALPGSDVLRWVCHERVCYDWMTINDYHGRRWMRYLGPMFLKRVL